MKKNVFSKILLILISVIFFVGCNKAEPIAQSPPSTPPTKPVEEQPEEELPSEKKIFTEYFKSNVDIEYITKNEYVVDVDCKTILFSSALLRQLELISNDILYRLFSVYGGGAQLSESNEEEAYFLTYGNNNKFSCSGNFAQINYYDVIQTPKTFEDDSPVFAYSNGQEVSLFSDNAKYPNINEVASYSFALKDGKWEESVSLLTSSFRNTSAISGGYAWKTETNNFNELELNSELAWNWNFNNLHVPQNNNMVAYWVYNNAYYNLLMNGIANALVNDGNVYDLNSALSKINHLGFTETDKDNIINFIYNSVIGVDLINYDNLLLDKILAKIPNGVLTEESVAILEDEEHNYKAYDLLIPAIVEQAVNMVFHSTTKPIYLKETLLEKKVTSTNFNTLLNKNFTRIIIYPKTENVSLTKLIIKFNITNLEVGYNIYTSETQKINEKDANYLLYPNKILTLDFSKYYDSYKLSETGFIELLITPTENVNYNITFNGYYNKI